MYFTYAEQNRTFQSLGVWADRHGECHRPGRAGAGAHRRSQRRRACKRSAFRPPSGRWLCSRRSDSAGQAPATTVMLSYGYWQRRFGGDRSVIGRNITVDSRPREIVGVMPQGFRLVNADSI